MKTLVCVYRSGGDFTPQYVEVLLREFRRYHGADWTTLCLTDRLVDVLPLEHRPDTISAFRHNFPGWWSKLEIFRVLGPAVYVDLDTAILGPLDPVLEVPGDRLAVLRDLGGMARPQTGILAWQGDWQRVLASFLAGVPPATFDSPGGDAEWLREWLFAKRERWEWVQDRLPNIASFKLGRLQHDDDPGGSTVVCFHGRPRPHESLRCPWMAEYWNGTLRAGQGPIGVA